MVEKAILSVLERAGNEVEVVVVDDGSTDGTAVHLQSKLDPRIKIIALSTPGGANSARNLGATAASAPLIAFLDSDDVFLPGRAARLIRFFSENPGVDATHDGFVDIGAKRFDDHAMPSEPLGRAELRHFLISHRVPLTNSTVTVRREAFETVGGFDEALRRQQDRDLLLRLNERHRVVLGGTIDVHKFRGTASISHGFDGYIAGLDAFAGRIPESRMGYYEDLFRYLMIRGIIKTALQGHFTAALREIRKGLAVEHLPQGLLMSLFRYRAGKAFRRTAPPPSCSS